MIDELNQDLITKINFLPNEKLIWHGKPSKYGILFRTRLYFYFFLVALIPLTMILMAADQQLINKKMKANVTKKALHSSSEKDCQNRPETVDINKIGYVLLIAGFLLLPIVAYFMAKKHFSNTFYFVTNERIGIQTGLLGRYLIIIDIDKVGTVSAAQDVIEAKFGILSIEFNHANVAPPTAGVYEFKKNVFLHIDQNLDVLSKISNVWLPRDNRQGS